MEKIDYFLIVFGVILVVITLLVILLPDEIGSLFSLEIWTNPESTFDLTSGLIAVSVACFIGALVPFPVPYVLVVSVVAFQLWNQPEIAFLSFILVVLVATVTNIIGDIFDYIIGLGAGKVKEKSSEKESNPEAENRWAKIIYSKPKLIPYIIFLFGCTPLPDSLLLMPLGVVKYSFKKMVLWSTVGKFLMMFVVALAGVIGFNTLNDLLGGDDPIFGLVILYLSYILVILMTKID